MTDNAKKFLEFISKDETLKKELMSAKGIDEALNFAKAHGYKLTAEDFESAKMDELSEDEMEAVAGGAMNKITSTCSCGQTGNGFTWELNCSCNNGGEGHNTTNGGWRCGCGGSFGIGAA